MEGLINFLIILFVVISVLARVKKTAKAVQKTQFGKKTAEESSFITPSFGSTGITLPQAIPNLLGPNSKNLDKIVKVYGIGAALSADEVSILLNVSPESAVEYLTELERSGKAQRVTSLGGRTRYKLI